MSSRSRARNSGRKSSVISRRVVNASPLIFLSKVGLLEVLRGEGVPVVVPDVVIAEVGALGPNDPSYQAVQAAGWVQVVPVPAPAAVLPTSLDAGEAAVLTLA